MEIKKFKLIDGGRGGITITSKEFLMAGGFQIVDDVNRSRKIMLSAEIIEEIGKLKYFFLNLTGHWIAPYSKHYDYANHKVLPLPETPKSSHILLKELWNKTEMTGASITEKGFVLTGKIEVVTDKWVGIATPLITEEDDIGFYSDCIALLQKVNDFLIRYIKSASIPLEAAKKTVPAEVRVGKTDEEIGELAMEYMMKRGAIIMMDENSPDAIPENTEEVTVHKNTNSIDGKNLPKAEEPEPEKDMTKEYPMTPEEAYEGPQEEESVPVTAEPVQEETIPQDEAITSQPEKVNPFGPPASKIPPLGEEPNVPNTQGEDLSGLEYSETMGSEASDEPVEEAPEW